MNNRTMVVAFYDDPHAAACDWAKIKTGKIREILTASGITPEFMEKTNKSAQLVFSVKNRNGYQKPESLLKVVLTASRITSKKLAE